MFKEKLQGLFPDIGAMQNQLDEKFDELVAELHTMQGILGDILAELRTQRGAPS
jgi:hypothetical protein